MKMLKVMALLSLLMLVVSCGGSTGATGAAKKYIIATDATYAPFEFQENGKYIGIDVDLITEIAKVEGFEFELKPMDFGGIIPALQSGQIDGAIAGASITDERKKSVDFSDPYYETGIVAVINSANTTIKTGKDLEGKKLAVKNGTAGASYVEENLKGKSEAVTFKDTVSMFQAVTNNQADAAFEDYPVIAYALSKDPASKLKIGTEKLTTGNYGFMVKKGSNPELVAKFNEGLKKLKANGKYDEIVAKYVGKK